MRNRRGRKWTITREVITAAGRTAWCETGEAIDVSKRSRCALQASVLKRFFESERESEREREREREREKNVHTSLCKNPTGSR